MSTNKILLVDDEPEYLGWVADFLENNKFEVEYAGSVEEAKNIIKKDRYKLIIIDMNIPFESTQLESLKYPIQQKYGGAQVVQFASDVGYKGIQLIAFTVHDDDDLEKFLERYNSRYVLKGRPDVFKSVVRKHLSL